MHIAFARMQISLGAHVLVHPRRSNRPCASQGIPAASGTRSRHTSSAPGRPPKHDMFLPAGGCALQLQLQRQGWSQHWMANRILVLRALFPARHDRQASCLGDGVMHVAGRAGRRTKAAGGIRRHWQRCKRLVCREHAAPSLFSIPCFNDAARGCLRSPWPAS